MTRVGTTAVGLDGRALRDAFGCFPTGVVAVAAKIGGRLVGLAASSFTSVSLDPPLASFSVATASATWPALRRAARLGMTVLAEDHGALCRRLSGPAADRFAGVTVDVTPDGAAMLVGGVAWFDCSVREEVAAGDHVIVLLDLHGVLVLGASRPLVFHRSGFGRLAADAHA